MVWIIGRDGDIKINKPGVSREHAKLIKKSDGSFTIEDLNSTNGTFVNGQRIVVKNITLSDQVQLAGTIDIDLRALLRSVLPEDNAELIEKFNNLRDVYDEYNKKKVKIQSETISSVTLKRSLPMVVPGIIGLIALTIGEEGRYIAIAGAVLSLIGILYGIKAASKDQAKLPEKLTALEDQLRVEYVCPKCRNFLGNLPWQNLYNRGQCIHCKLKWKD